MGYQPYTNDLQNADFVAVQNEPVNRSVSNSLKRATDVLIAASALIFLLPVLVPIALCIKLRDGGPALFRQRRIGRDGKEFMCYKFRSMVIDADVQLRMLLESDPQARAEWQATQKLNSDPRITAFGAFLRKSSLDELPQLFNILKGEMSVVGPRPIVRCEIEKYGEYFRHYCQVRPGLTGLWQVSGRSTTSYDARVALDVEYVNEYSYMNDLKIIVKTVPAVLRSEGAH